jgi:hypothetical protein
MPSLRSTQTTCRKADRRSIVSYYYTFMCFNESYVSLNLENVLDISGSRRPVRNFTCRPDAIRACAGHGPRAAPWQR